MNFPLKISGVAPISMNMAFPTGKGGRRFKSAQYKDFEKEVTKQLQSNYPQYIKAFKDKFDEYQYITMNYRFYFPFINKKGTRINLNSKDVSNCIKIIEDVISKNFGFNDSCVVSICACKIHSENPSIEVDLNTQHINNIL